MRPNPRTFQQTSFNQSQFINGIFFNKFSHDKRLLTKESGREKNTQKKFLISNKDTADLVSEIKNQITEANDSAFFFPIDDICVCVCVCISSRFECFWRWHNIEKFSLHQMLLEESLVDKILKHFR